MQCPACRGVMVVAERHNIEIDYCTNCFGVWFDAGEVDLLPHSITDQEGGATMAAMLALPERTVAENVRRCPMCGVRMRKTGIGRGQETIIDICPKGHGLWFDRGELQHIMEASGEVDEKHAPLAAFISDIFGASHGRKQGQGG